MFVAHDPSECEADADDGGVVSCSWGGDQSGVAVGGVNAALRASKCNIVSGGLGKCKSVAE